MQQNQQESEEEQPQGKQLQEAPLQATQEGVGVVPKKIPAGADASKLLAAKVEAILFHSVSSAEEYTQLSIQEHVQSFARAIFDRHVRKYEHEHDNKYQNSRRRAFVKALLVGQDEDVSDHSTRKRKIKYDDIVSLVHEIKQLRHYGPLQAPTSSTSTSASPFSSSSGTSPPGSDDSTVITPQVVKDLHLKTSIINFFELVPTECIPEIPWINLYDEAQNVVKAYKDACGLSKTFVNKKEKDALTILTQSQRSGNRIPKQAQYSWRS